MDERRDRGPARPRRGRPERAARDEPGLPRARRDEHLGRRGGHRRHAAEAAQPLALVERVRAPRGDRDARCRRPPRRRCAHVGQADPGWRPNLDSPALAASRRVYERLFGEAPIVTAVHAWLETAVIGDRVPRPRHGLVRPADRGAALARRTREHPDRRRGSGACSRASSTSSRPPEPRTACPAVLALPGVHDQHRHARMEVNGGAERCRTASTPCGRGRATRGRSSRSRPRRARSRSRARRRHVAGNCWRKHRQGAKQGHCARPSRPAAPPRARARQHRRPRHRRIRGRSGRRSSR